jgi:hypothetical protein
MTLLAAALLLAGTDPSQDQSARPQLQPKALELSPAVAEADPNAALRLELGTLKARRDGIYWFPPAVLTIGGFYVGWTGAEALVVTDIVGCHGTCNAYLVEGTLAAAGGLLTLAGIGWLAWNYYRRVTLNNSITAIEQQLCDARFCPPAAAPPP